MPNSIAKSFTEFLTQIEPASSARQATPSIRKPIEQELKQQAGVARWVPAGSIRTSTSVRGFSAMDMLVVFAPRRVLSSSHTVVEECRQVIAHAVPKLEILAERGAIVVPFGPGNSDRYRVIPARSFELGEDNEEVYGIPDGAGDWSRTSPSLQQRYLDAQDKRTDATLRPLIRFVKAWKHLNEVPISSFYLEVAVATYLAQQPTVLYTQALWEIFRDLSERSLPSLKDPTNVSGLVQPCGHVFQRVAAQSAVGRALENIVLARKAAKANKIEEALGHWKQLYNGAFPEPGAQLPS